MKKHLLFISLFLLLGITMSAQTSNKKYENNWGQVEKFEKDDLPQSAAQEVEKILQTAISDKNNTQVIKALIYKNKYKKYIDENDNQGLISDLQGLISQTSDISEKALLHSMLSELYIKYYNNNRWKYDQRTALSDIIPDDMQEWSSNIFINKTIENIGLSIEEKDALLKRTTKEYSDIINLGEDSKRFYPTLYDFLMYRAIDISEQMSGWNWQKIFDTNKKEITVEQLASPADEYIKLNIGKDKERKSAIFIYYQEYSKSLIQRGLKETIILTDLNRIKYLRNRANSFPSVKLLDAYTSLEKKHRGNELTTEIIFEIVNTLLNFQYERPEKEGENNKDKYTEQAYEWIQKGLSQYPSYYRIGILKNSLEQMKAPSLTIDGERLTAIDKPINIKILYKNTQAIEEPIVLKLYRNNAEGKSLVKEFPLNISSKKTYIEDKDSISIGKLEPGKYNLVYNEEKDKYRQNTFEFIVSDLTTFWRNGNNNEYEIFVVNRISGKPVENAVVNIFPEKYIDGRWKASSQISLKTNNLGLTTYKHEKTDDKYGNRIGYYKIALGKDSSFNSTQLYGRYDSYDYINALNKDKKSTINIFADRSIYRPGQTVYFKAIAVRDDKPSVKENLTAQLLNPNGEKVSEIKLVTNEFGSASGQFILPQTGLQSTYRININDDSYYFRVEEYKRPTFEITFDTINQTYKFGEKVTIKGYAKNFSGISLQDAEVNYTIDRRQFSFWFWRGNQEQVDNGTVTTKDDGSFEITFTPQPGDEKYQPLRDKRVYSFDIRASVTDLNGETQENSYSVVVGKVSMLINLEMADKIEKANDESKINIIAKNLNGKDIQTSGTYIVYKLDNKDSIQSKVLEGTFKTGEQPELKARLLKLPSAKYQIQVKALDNSGIEVDHKQDVVLYSYNDKKPPYQTNEWLVSKNTTFSTEKPAEVIFGVTDKDFYVYYQLYNNDNIFERKIVKLSNTNKTFTVPYKTEYGDQIYMNFTYVKNGKMYSKNTLLNKQSIAKDNKLTVKTEVFRDKLRPGQEETWTVSVKDNNDKAVDAEVLASMYDISLNKLSSYNQWIFRDSYIYKRPLSALFYNNPLNNNYSYPINFNLPNRKETVYQVNRMIFDRFYWFGYFNSGIFYSVENETSNDGWIRGKLAGITANAPAFASDAVLQDNVVVGFGVAKKSMTGSVASVNEHKLADIKEDSAEMDENGGVGAAPQIRQNFNETAFFYPHLRTNEKGETLVSFTVPESNTSWRFRIFAHDKDLKRGGLESFVVTRKELMVTPNMPRFVRQGDKTSISTKVSNLSDKAIVGNVSIQFFDPATDKAINISIANQKQDFSIDKNKSTSVFWTFDIPKDIELIGCRIVAQSESFSDGEQHVLSVLPNRMLVTESMAFDVETKGKSAFTFDKLANNKSTSLDNYKLTLEYANNPAWYAVQALPTMSNPANENAVNWFASYYVNSLGSSIVRQYPKVAAMIEAWKKQGGDKETLVSKLQKNEELKNVLLEETPWVLDAKNETEQMQRLSLLFDLNNTKQLTDAAIRKLTELQTYNDGWSWYKNMYPSRSITQYILYGFAELQLVGQMEYPQEVKEMQMKALRYIDTKLKEEFENMKKYNDNWKDTKNVSTSQLEFLFVRSFYRDIPIDQETREAERFYTSVASEYWADLDLYQRSILIPVLIKNGDKKLADKIAKSIRQRAVVNKELGMYWPNLKGNVFLSLSAVSRHTFLMDALKETGASDKEMNQMKKWLLKQKQTQVWESTHASIDAISALLRYGDNWFTGETASTEIKVGSKTVAAKDAELGTGYVKQTWHKPEIANDMAKVEISRTNTEPAYGALYWQYFEDMDKITSQKNNLNVSKQLFKEVTTNTGKSLEQITESNSLTVGDKVIVRLTVKSDRDMEFVQLKDMRASCFEPVQTLSGVEWKNQVMYYKTTKDASTNFYFDHLPKGTYVFEYPVYVNRSGEYSNGITTIQCLYAPEFISHTQGIKVMVKEKK